MEVHFHGNFYCDGLSVFFSGFKPPGFDGLYGFRIETAAQGTNDVNLRGKALFVHDKPKCDNTLIFCLPRRLGELGTRLEDGPGGRDASAHKKNSRGLPLFWAVKTLVGGRTGGDSNSRNCAKCWRKLAPRVLLQSSATQSGENTWFPVVRNKFWKVILRREKYLSQQHVDAVRGHSTGPEVRLNAEFLCCPIVFAGLACRARHRGKAGIADPTHSHTSPTDVQVVTRQAQIVHLNESIDGPIPGRGRPQKLPGRVVTQSRTIVKIAEQQRLALVLIAKVLLEVSGGSQADGNDRDTDAQRCEGTDKSRYSIAPHGCGW